jgi:hypothetical protein
MIGLFLAIIALKFTDDCIPTIWGDPFATNGILFYLVGSYGEVLLLKSISFLGGWNSVFFFA